MEGGHSPRKANKLILVRPENRFVVLLHVHRRENMVQVHNGVLGPVANHDEEAALLLVESIADERGDPRVTGENGVRNQDEGLTRAAWRAYTALRVMLADNLESWCARLGSARDSFSVKISLPFSRKFWRRARILPGGEGGTVVGRCGKTGVGGPALALTRRRPASQETRIAGKTALT